MGRKSRRSKIASTQFKVNGKFSQHPKSGDNSGDQDLILEILSNTINSILDDICQVFPDEENENLERWTEDPESEVFDENEEYDEEDDGSDNFRDIFFEDDKDFKESMSNLLKWREDFDCCNVRYCGNSKTTYYRNKRKRQKLIENAEKDSQNIVSMFRRPQISSSSSVAMNNEEAICVDNDTEEDGYLSEQSNLSEIEFEGDDMDEQANIYKRNGVGISASQDELKEAIEALEHMRMAA